MTFRGITADRDWTFGQGRGNYFVRQQAVAANIVTTVRSFLHDCFFDMHFGIDWWNLLGTKLPEAKANILLQVRQAIVSCYGVVRINSVEARIDAATRTLTLNFNVDTIFSQNVTGTVQIP